MTPLCKTCKHELSNDRNSEWFDCGGDCMTCMGDLFEGPDCVAALNRIRNNQNASQPGNETS